MKESEQNSIEMRIEMENKAYEFVFWLAQYSDSINFTATINLFTPRGREKWAISVNKVQ